MKKIGVVLASVALAVGVVFFGSYTGPTVDMRKAGAQTVPAQPNIVFILTDDMRKDDLQYMPKTRSLLEGVVQLGNRQPLHHHRRLAGLPAKR